MRTPVSIPKLLAYCGCAALIFGSLGPWQSSLSTSQAGIDGGGLYTLLLAVIAALVMIPRRTCLTATVGIGLVCLIVTVYNVFDVASATRQPIAVATPSVEVGWGLWLAALGAVVLIAGAVLFRGEIAGWGARRFGEPDSRGGAASLWIRSHPGIFGLLVLLGVGVALRIWLTLVWSPAFTGYSDTGIYFTGAVESLWSDPIRMVGYSMFLRAIHSIDPHLLTVILAQHAIGLGTAALLFFAVRRCGGPRWLGLAPAAVIALGGDELFFEHAALSDALFIALIAATLYATVRRRARARRDRRCLAGAQPGSSDPPDADGGGDLAGRRPRHGRRLRGLAQRRGRPTGHAHREQRLEPLRPRRAVGGLRRVLAAAVGQGAVRDDARLAARLSLG